MGRLIGNVGVVLACLMVVAQTFIEPRFNFFPMVQEARLGTDTLDLKNPCSILFKFKKQISTHSHILELLKHYQLRTFGCQASNLEIPGLQEQLHHKNPEYTISINIQHPQLKSAFKKQEQKYSLNITKEGATIDVSSYVGLVRAIQTFYQSLNCSESHKVPCQFSNLPIQVTDYPQFEYRGLMIDTAHHYLPVHLILETIDAMMYNKMNVLHWHITDDDSFPLLLEKHPELANNGAFSKQQVYTTNDVRSIVHYAMVRGVRIVPEIPTPGYSSSWAKGQGNSSCKAQKSESGGINIQDNKTLQLVQEVFEQIFQLFPDPIVHLGGKSLSDRCLADLQKQNKNKQPTQQLQPTETSKINQLYRKVQRQALKKLNSSKVFMYWESQAFQGEEQDIVQWTGNGLPETSNKVVITRDHLHRLDSGVGDSRGASTTSYLVWMFIYQNNLQKELNGYKNKDNVLGSQMVLWSHTSNDYTHHIKVWVRTSCLAQRLWNSKIENVRPNVLRRITRHQRIMDKRGIPSAPVTCEQCEFNPERC